MARKTLSLLVLAAAVFASCSDARKSESPEQAKIADGFQIAEAQCSRCHAIGRDGTSTHPKAPEFRTILTQYDEAALADDLAEGIRIGHPDMPIITLRPEGVDALIAYVRSVQTKP